jgi:hypothetical protein|tara:strand:- start:21226 stop:21555 length:330 start_codon:yes stop_codon:yes gene_type:complete
MAQLRVNGAVAEGQLLVGSLSHFIIDEVDGTDDISNFGFTTGDADPGEAVIQALSIHCTPVLINSISATVMHVGVEGSPDVTKMTASIKSVLTGGGANATVTAGEYRVV